VPRWAGRILTAVLLLITWVFFRAESLEVAMRYLTAMFGGGNAGEAATLLHEMLFHPLAVVQLLICLGIAAFLPNTGKFLARLSIWKVIGGVCLLVISVRVMAVQGFNPFLYFQF